MTPMPDTRADSQTVESSDFVYKVAELAWRYGLSPSSIAAKLEARGDPKMIMKVKRALRRAIKDGTLALNVPNTKRYDSDLRKLWPRVEFTVVRTDLFAIDAVHIAAADRFASKIEELWNGAERDVVVANAGGHAVSQTVRYLHQRIAPVLEPHPHGRLVFISLNSAGRASRFQQSSNFIAVRLAEIYGGDHITVLGAADTSADKEYKKRLENIDLLICGAGGPESLLVERAREEKIKLPTEMVGDLAYVPLDEQGRRVTASRLQTIIENHLHAEPPYDEILRIAAQPPRAVMVVLSGASKMASKLPIARAVLRGALASHCILDLPLVKALTSRSEVV